MYIETIKRLQNINKNIFISKEYIFIARFDNPLCGDFGYIYKFNNKYIFQGKGCVLFQSSCQLLNQIEYTDNIEAYIAVLLEDLKNIFMKKYDRIKKEEFIIYMDISNPKRFDCISLPWIKFLIHRNGGI